MASKLVERQRRYKSVLIPVGLVRVLRVLSDVHVFYRNREDFDLDITGSYRARFPSANFPASGIFRRRPR